jgi:hypothetical protein
MIFPHHLKIKKNWMMVMHLDLLEPYKGALGVSGLKKAAVVAVREKSPQ